MKNQWIPVTERLPEEDGCEYLVVVNVIHRFVSIAVYEEEGWFIEAYPDLQDPIVTHWMPLPEPPKEDVASDDELPF